MRRKLKFDEAVHGQSMGGDDVEELLADSLSASAIENRGVVEDSAKSEDIHCR